MDARLENRLAASNDVVVNDSISPGFGGAVSPSDRRIRAASVPITLRTSALLDAVAVTVDTTLPSGCSALTCSE